MLYLVNVLLFSGLCGSRKSCFGTSRFPRRYNLMLSCFHVFYSLGQPFVEEFVDLHSQLGELQIHTHTEANLLPEFITKATVL